MAELDRSKASEPSGAGHLIWVSHEDARAPITWAIFIAFLSVIAETWIRRGMVRKVAGTHLGCWHYNAIPLLLSYQHHLL